MKMRIHRGALVVAAVAALVGFPLFSGLALAADKHVGEALEHAKEAVAHGKQGHADVLVKHAEEALKHARGGQGRIRMWMKGSSISRKPWTMARPGMPMWPHNMPKARSPICPK